MYYVMIVTDNVSTRYGRMFKSDAAAIRLAQRVGGYVEKYGHGVIWTPKMPGLLH